MSAGHSAPGWRRRAIRVVFGVQDPQSTKIAPLLEHARAASVAEAIDQSDVVILATPWEAVEQIVALRKDWSGKIIVDAHQSTAAAASRSGNRHDHLGSRDNCQMGAAGPSS